MAKAVIVAGVRTPFARAGTALRETSAQELGRLAMREVLYRAEVKPGEVDEVIAGNVATPPDAVNIARVIGLSAGIPFDRVGHTVSRNCASGFECVTQAVERIQSGQARTVVAVGVESMSNIPVLWRRELVDHFLGWMRARSWREKLRVIACLRPRHLKPDLALKLGLTDPHSGLILGETAEKIGREFGISREEQDDYAVRSHRRAAEAWKSGRFSEEVMTVYPSMPAPLTHDNGPRTAATPEALGKLVPYFDRKFGAVTVGNACQITDGAVALLLMEKDAAAARGIRPLGRVIDHAYAGCEPDRMGLGPVHATARLLKQTGYSLADIELLELNEAFAAQVLACERAFASKRFFAESMNGGGPLGEIDPNRLNVNGGAIALGHPIGATGTRLLLTLLLELRRRKQHLGLASLCVGGGQGGAVLVEAFEPETTADANPVKNSP